MINIKEVIEAAKLDKQEVAAQLFPRAKHADLALNRVIRGESELDASQIEKLSVLSGVPVDQLFTGGWKVRNKKGVFFFHKDDIRAKLNTEDWTTKIFRSGSLVCETVLHSGAITVSEYTKLITEKLKEND